MIVLWRLKEEEYATMHNSSSAKWKKRYLLHYVIGNCYIDTLTFHKMINEWIRMDGVIEANKSTN